MKYVKDFENCTFIVSKGELNQGKWDKQLYLVDWLELGLLHRYIAEKKKRGEQCYLKAEVYDDCKRVSNFDKSQ